MKYLLGCNVGTCCAMRSSFNIWSKVVLPALSNPRNKSFPLFFHSPKKTINSIFLKELIKILVELTSLDKISQILHVRQMLSSYLKNLGHLSSNQQETFS